MCEILIADNHPIFGLGMETILREQGFSQIDHVASGENVVEAARAREPEILILGQQIGETQGSEIFAALRATGNTTPTILLAENLDSGRLMDAIESGIDGLITKKCTPEAMRECLRDVRRGRRWIDQRHLQTALAMALGRKEKTSGRFPNLTRREEQVVDLVADNLSNKQIADRLKISVGTVKVHLHNIYGKLGLANRIDLVLLTREDRREPELAML